MFSHHYANSSLNSYLFLIIPLFVLSACGGSGGGGDDDDSSEALYTDPVVILNSNTLDQGFSALGVADLNGDGFDDFVGTRTTGLQSGAPAEMLIMINDRNGSLTDETASFIDGAIPTFNVARDFYIRDFNGDNQLDIFFSNQGKELTTVPSTNWPCEQNTLLLSQSDGRLKDATTNLPAVADFSHGSSVADIDGDMDLDIWVNNLGCTGNPPGRLLRNDGNGVFTSIADLNNRGVILPAGNINSFWSQFIDYNNDGASELFMTDVADAKMLTNDGAGNFALTNNSTIPDGAGAVTTQHSEIFDVNADGMQDIVLYQTPDDFSPGHSLQVLINNGVGFNDESAARLPPQTSDNSGGNPRFWIADLEGDNDIDILVVKAGPSFTPEDDIFDFYRNNGFGSFSEIPEEDLPPIRPGMAPIDVNNDGKMDFIFTDVLGDNGDKASLMLTIAN